MDSYYVKKGLTGIVNGPKNLVLRQMDMLKPKWLVLMLTDLCNSRCVTCNIWQNKKLHEPLSPEELRTALSDPLFSELEYISNTGGEITTRMDLVQCLIVEHEVLPKAKLFISTNALMPERALECAKTMLEKGATIGVGVSLDGVGEKHDKIRGVKGNFAKVEWLLKELVELRKQYGEDRLDLIVGTILIDETLPNIAETQEYVKKFGIELNVQWYNSSPYYKNSGTVKEAQTDEIKKIVKTMPPTPLNEKWLKWLDGEPIRFTCFSMYRFCILKSNGDIAPCLTHWNVKAGNIRENTPAEVWKGIAAKEARMVVKNCSGCLNSWGTNWSFASSFFPFLGFYMANPGALPATPKGAVRKKNVVLNQVRPPESEQAA